MNHTLELIFHNRKMGLIEDEADNTPEEHLNKNINITILVNDNR